MLKKWHPVLLLPIISGLSLAEELSDTTELKAVQLDPIVVVASKAPRPLSDVVGQVSVIDSEFIKHYIVEDIDGLLRYEPGLDLESSGTRFGANAINIRGIGGNRVAMEVDGIPVRDRFAIGSYSDGGRILTETDRIKRLEILYGPASTLYGSDALGGVLAITTWDPDDLLARGNGRTWFSLRGGYQGADDSMVGSGVAAWGDENNGLAFAATWRDGHELDNQASADAPRDNQNWNSRDYLLRYSHETQAGNRLRLSVADYQRDTTTSIESLPGWNRFRRTTSLTGEDKDKNRQASVEYQFSGDWGNGVIRAFDTHSRTQQLTHEERAASSKPVLLQRYFEYEQDFSGVELNLFRDFMLTSSDHHLGMGIELLRTDSSEFRDGFQQSLIDGSLTRTVLGENLPVRDFPVSRTDEMGIFIQDEIRLGDGSWVIVPAIRYDRYQLDPRPDEIYLEDNPLTQVVSVDENRVSPRIGLLYRINDEAGVYLQYVNGFRAAPFEDANIGLDIPLFNIRAIPNPDLKSETSRGLEAGFRYISSGTRLTLAVFDTLYDDFIETKARIGLDPDSGVLLFQSRNIDQARIYGADLRLEQDLQAWNPAFEGWTLSGGLYWSRGENLESNQPLNTVSPPQMVLGGSWSSSDGRWDAHLTGTFTARQNRVDESAGERFHTPSWNTFDLTAGWKINDHLNLRAGIYNLTDKQYWRWSDVRLFSPDNPMLELMSRPGRNYSVTANFLW